MIYAQPQRPPQQHPQQHLQRKPQHPQHHPQPAGVISRFAATAHTRAVAALLMALTLVAGVVIGIGAPSASAHAILTGSDPEDAAELTEAPTQVTMQFNEEIGADFATLVVRGPDGAEEDRTSGDPEVVGNELIGDVEIDEPGAYTAAYRVTSADGHVVQGSTTFTLVESDDPGADAPGAGNGEGANGEGAGADTGAADDANGQDPETGIIDSDQVEPGAPADGALEDTGIGAGMVILAGLALLLIGGAILFLILGRRKREDASEAPDSAGAGPDSAGPGGSAGSPPGRRGR